MPLMRSAARALAAFVADIWTGNILLIRLITDYAARGYRAVRRLKASAADASARATGMRKGKPGRKRSEAAPAGSGPAVEKPAADSAEKAAPKPGERNGKQDIGKGAASATARKMHWTLDRLAGVGLLSWIVWCFTHRPVARGWHVVAPVLVTLAPWALACWLVAAWLTAQYAKNPPTRAARPKAGANGPQPGATGPAEPDAEAVRAAGLWLWHLVCTRVADAVAEGRRGVHLKTLIEEHAVPGTWTVETLREHCDRLGIPVKMMQIRGSGRGPTHGVHVDELTTTLGMPLFDATRRLTQHVAQARIHMPPTTALEAVPEGAPEGLSDGEEQTVAAPRRGLTLEQALRAWLTRPTDPANTAAHTPLPDLAPPAPGRG